MSKFIVTITPPTPNGDLHIGHICGPFMAADVFTKVQRQRGHDCVLVSYSDDYQSYMLRRGLEVGCNPPDLAKKNTRKIRESLQLIGVDVDHWLEAYGNDHFRKAVRDVYSAADEAGAIAWRSEPEPHCPRCHVWGYEAFGRGRCNFCGSDSDASQCEECARSPDARMMSGFSCKLCGLGHDWVPVQRAYLRLGRFQGVLSDLYARSRLRGPLRRWCDDILSGGLTDWAITRPGDAGLDLVIDGTRRVHTWFMGLSGYIAAFKEYAEQRGDHSVFDSFWTSGSGTLVNFLGFDCAFSHVVVYPALLNTLKGIAVGQIFYSNQFLTLDGLNLSTSRNHAVWIRDLVAEACPDSARLYLASIAPEDAASDFNRAAFKAWRRETFMGSIDWILTSRGDHPAAASHGMGEVAGSFAQAVRRRWQQASDATMFSMRELARLSLDILDTIREARPGSVEAGHLIALLAVCGRPLHPNLSDRLVEAFSIDEDEVIRWLSPT